jgi:hypothetical protein
LNNTQHLHADHPAADTAKSAAHDSSAGRVTIAGKTGHDQPEMPVTMPESPVTIIRNQWSRSAGIRNFQFIQHPQSRLALDDAA